MKVITDLDIKQINDEMEETTSKLIDIYEKAPKPDKETMMGNLYEEEPWYISEERGAIYKKAESYGFSGIRIDGTNFIEVYRATRKALENASEDPILIEAMTYRMGPHSTADDPNKYRTDRVPEGSEKDPLIVTQKLLKDMKVITDLDIKQINDEMEETTSKLIDTYEKAPKPELKLHHLQMLL